RRVLQRFFVKASIRLQEGESCAKGIEQTLEIGFAIRTNLELSGFRQRPHFERGVMELRPRRQHGPVVEILILISRVARQRLPILDGNRQPHDRHPLVAHGRWLVVSGWWHKGYCY